MACQLRATGEYEKGGSCTRASLMLLCLPLFRCEYILRLPDGCLISKCLTTSTAIALKEILPKVFAAVQDVCASVLILHWRTFP